MFGFLGKSKKYFFSSKGTTNFPNFLILNSLSTIKKLIGNDLVTELNSPLCLIFLLRFTHRGKGTNNFFN